MSGTKATTPGGGLRPRQLSVISSLAEVLIPEDETPLPPGTDPRLADRVQELVSLMPHRQRRMIGWLIDAWDLTPMASRHHCRFTQMDLSGRRSWFSASLTRPQTRIAVQFLKQLVFLAYGSLPQVEALVGYDYSCLRDGDLHGSDLHR